MSRNPVCSPEEAATALGAMTLVGLAPRPIDLLPLLRLGCLTHMASCEAADAGWAERFGVDAFSLEAKYGMRRRWRAAHLDELLPHIPRLLAAFGGHEHAVLVPYGLPERRRSLPHGLHHLVAPSAAACRSGRPDLADKVAVRRWLAGLDVPVPASCAVPPDHLDFGRLVQRLGSPFVLQMPAGSAGIGTYLVADEADIERIKRDHPAVRVWLASAYVGDTTLNLHGLVTGAGGVVISQPSLQLANLPQVGSGFGEYCGSDFAAPALLPPAVLGTCRAVVQRIGVGLAALDYRGLFGVDVGIGNGAVSVLEVNGSVQASTWLLGEIELAQGGLPLLARHALELSGQATAGEPADGPAPGAQLVIRHTGPSGQVAAVPAAGRYRYQAGRLHWQGEGIGLADCEAADIIVTGLARPGVTVTPGAALGRLVTRQLLAASDGRSLRPDAASLVAAFRNAVTVTPYKQTDVAAGTVPRA